MSSRLGVQVIIGMGKLKGINLTAAFKPVWLFLCPTSQWIAVPSTSCPAGNLLWFWSSNPHILLTFCPISHQSVSCLHLPWLSCSPLISISMASILALSPFPSSWALCLWAVSPPPNYLSSMRSLQWILERKKKSKSICVILHWLDIAFWMQWKPISWSIKFLRLAPAYFSSFTPPCACFALSHAEFAKLQGFCLQRRQWHPAPVLLPGESHGWKSLVGSSSKDSVISLLALLTRIPPSVVIFPEKPSSQHLHRDWPLLGTPLCLSPQEGGTERSWEGGWESPIVECPL